MTLVAILDKKNFSKRNLKNRIDSQNGVIFGQFFPTESETLKSAPENASLIMSNHLVQAVINNLLQDYFVPQAGYKVFLSTGSVLRLFQLLSRA